MLAVDTRQRHNLWFDILLINVASFNLRDKVTLSFDVIWPRTNYWREKRAASYQIRHLSRSTSQQAKRKKEKLNRPPASSVFNDGKAPNCTECVSPEIRTYTHTHI
jgi:hypothetical protein